jgi:hypothetical protein
MTAPEAIADDAAKDPANPEGTRPDLPAATRLGSEAGMRPTAGAGPDWTGAANRVDPLPLPAPAEAMPAEPVLRRDGARLPSGSVSDLTLAAGPVGPLPLRPMTEAVPARPPVAASAAQAGSAAPPTLSAAAELQPEAARAGRAEGGVAPEEGGEMPRAAAPPALPRGIPAYWAARMVAEPDATTRPGQAATDAAAPARAVAQPLQIALPAGPPPQPDPAAVETLVPGDAAHPGDEIASLALQGGGAAEALPAGAPADDAGPPVLPKALPVQIAAALAARTERPVDLQIVTEELGGLHLSLQQDGPQVHVALQAERGDTLDLLRRHGDLLLQELRTAGFSSATLSFGDGGADRGRPAPPQDGAATPPAPAPAAPSPALPTAPAAGAGLDLRY